MDSEKYNILLYTIATMDRKHHFGNVNLDIRTAEDWNPPKLNPKSSVMTDKVDDRLQAEQALYHKQSTVWQ